LVIRRPHRKGNTPATKRLATRSPLIRLNAVCPYYTMFPLDFPFSLLTKAEASQWVLDPFCGRGTTLFAARLLGLPCVGIDSNPIAAAVAAAKLADATAEDIVEAAIRILRQSKPPREVPEGAFWRYCFHRSTLRDICVIRERLLRSCRRPAEIVLRALMLGILHGPRHKGPPTYLSNQMPRTYATKPAAATRFWRREGMTTPPAVDVLDAVSRRAKHALADTPPPVGGAVYFGDARRATELLPRGRRFSWVVTSPPYFGLRTYRSDQWLRNWFLGGTSDVDYREGGQLAHHAGKFSDELANVWRSVGRRCLPGARLIVRFGSLPSIPVDARDLLRDSLDSTAIGWRIYRWADAGSSSNGKRQAQQFGHFSSTPAREFDMYARLEV
jgi:DNA modification methylase